MRFCRQRADQCSVVKGAVGPTCPKRQSDGSGKLPGWLLAPFVLPGSSLERTNGSNSPLIIEGEHVDDVEDGLFADRDAQHGSCTARV